MGPWFANLKNKTMNRQSPKIDKKAVGIGLKAGIIASLCCVIPLILIIFGLSSASLALKFVKYKPYFIILSVAFLTGSLWYFFKKKRCCSPEENLNKKWFIGIALGVHLLTFLLLLYVLMPNISPFLYNLSFGKTESRTSNNPISQQLSLKISGMTCSSCAMGIEYNLENLAGIIKAKVSYYKGQGIINYDPDKITPKEILESEVFSDGSPYSAEIIQ